MSNDPWAAGRLERLKKRLTPGALCLAAPLAFAACDRAPRAAADNGSHDLLDPSAQVVGTGPSPSEVGQTARARDYELAALEVRICPGSAAFDAPPGTRRLGVLVKVTGLTALEVPINPFYAQLVSDTGQRVEPTLAGCRPALEARPIHKGQSTEGWVSFDLPEALEENLVFRYAPVVIGVGTEQVSLQLPRP